jgi:hypothetical protein
MGTPFRLDRKGVGELLKTEFVDEINRITDELADRIGTDAEVEYYTTDRRAAAVTVPAIRQATDGALTRAAAALGLEVRAR